MGTSSPPVTRSTSRSRSRISGHTHVSSVSGSAGGCGVPGGGWPGGPTAASVASAAVRKRLGAYQRLWWGGGFWGTHAQRARY
jgi:hypothetical protein